jgi:predicted enzyme related to lactoylglutathione lyase
MELVATQGGTIGWQWVNSIVTVWGGAKIMKEISARLVGVELYFDDLDLARSFYTETLGLKVSEEQEGRFTKFDGGAGFLCLERKGSESYPSRDKAVLFFQVPDLGAAISAIGQDQIVQSQPGWAVVHDPEGHNVLLLQGK